MAKLTDEDIAAGLAELAGWERRGDAIAKTYQFAAFAEGIQFIDRVAAEADRMDHHPDIDVRWTSVTMICSTHSAGGITRRDLRLAAAIDRLAS